METSLQSSGFDRALSVVRSFASSAAVGVAASVVDWGVLVGAVWIGVPKRYAVIPALIAGAAVQFLGNRRFAFSSDTISANAVVARQLRRFIVVELGTLIVNAIVYALLLERARIDYRIARPLAAFVVYVAFSYPLWRWAFASQPATEPERV